MSKSWVKIVGDQVAPLEVTGDKLKPGFYNFGAGFLASAPKHDSIIATGLAKEIIADVDKFSAAADLYKRMGFLHKRGYLLISAPGVGKSMTAMLVANHTVSNNGVVLLPRSVRQLEIMCSMVRGQEPDTPLCAIVEDIEDWYEDDRENLLDILDGQQQVGGIITVATTNHPEKLAADLLNRPGRFDIVRWVGPPEAATRREYLRQILPQDIPNETVEEMIHHTDGFLISHMREMVCKVFIQGNSVKEAATILRTIMDESKKNDAAKKAMNELQDKMPPDLAKQLKGLRNDMQEAKAA